jgi:MFS transporter, DHA1 family, inner membrane transport protein
VPYADYLVLRNVWVASFVLSLSLLGDALLYVVLPVHADAFGVSLAMVGFLLAINRIIRTFAYGFIADLAERIGLKKLCLIAATTAVLSTLGYTLLNGAVWLSLARIMWGLSYAALLLITLSYAAINPRKTGTRIGLSRSVEQIGPLFAMTVGAWLATIVGPKTVFGYLAIISGLAVLLAFFLFEKAQPKIIKRPAKRDRLFPRPDSLDTLIFWMGAGIDGVFTLSISLMWAQQVSIELAILIGGSILAARRLSEMLMAPFAGIIADQFGTRLPLTITIMASICGFVLIGFSWLVVGSCLLVLARGALGTLFAAAVAKIYQDSKIKALARNQTWRDIGAAAGPLVTGAALTIVSPELLHLGLAVAFTGAFLWFLRSPGWCIL